MRLDVTQTVQSELNDGNDGLNFTSSEPPETDALSTQRLLFAAMEGVSWDDQESKAYLFKESDRRHFWVLQTSTSIHYCFVSNRP